MGSEQPTFLRRAICSERFRKDDAVAFDGNSKRARRIKLLRAYLRVAEFFVERQQLAARTQDAKIDPTATSTATVIFGRFDHHAPQSSSLPRRIDRKHSEIAALATQFSVNTRCDLI